MRYTELPLSAQTAYAEVFEQARSFELNNALAGLTGSFQKLARKNQEYWYFAYRDLDQRVRMVYIGPNEERVRTLVQRFDKIRLSKPLVPQSQAALVLGCTATVPKHFRMIKRLSEYGFFRAGGVLIGTHAFLAMGNLLGVRWNDGAATLDVDFAHAGKNISVALPADLRIDVHSALESLEMGLLPIAQFMPCAGKIVRLDCPQRAHCHVANCLCENDHTAQFAPCIASRWEQSNPNNFPRARHNGKAGTQYLNPEDRELRLDFVTSATRSGKPVNMPELNLALEPLKFMEFSLQDTTGWALVS